MPNGVNGEFGKRFRQVMAFNAVITACLLVSVVDFAWSLWSRRRVPRPGSELTVSRATD
jgi:hypothetical protein